MASVDTGRERAATLEYCLEMLSQVAGLLQQRAAEPDLAAILRALVASQQRPPETIETTVSGQIAA